MRDLQAQTDLGIHCKEVSFVLAPHATAFVRLKKINNTCTLPAPPPPICPGGPAPQHFCRTCAVPSQPCSFPVPPLPPCPKGFSEHTSGFWCVLAVASCCFKDQELKLLLVCRSKADQAPPGIPGKTVTECGAMCSAKAGCRAFEVYDPQGVTVPRSGCYTFTGNLTPPFTNDKRGLIRTCTKAD